MESSVRSWSVNRKTGKELSFGPTSPPPFLEQRSAIEAAGRASLLGVIRVTLPAPVDPDQQSDSHDVEEDHDFHRASVPCFAERGLSIK